MAEHAEPLFGEEVVHKSGQLIKKKNDLVYQRRKKKGKWRGKELDQPVILDEQGLIGNQAEETQALISGVSPFDPSVENHFRAMDKISLLCGEEDGPVEEDEMRRLSERVTFLREWKHFSYKQRTIRFASETEKDKNLLDEINLSQFSSAAVPKVEGLSNEPNLTPSRNDFVFYAGGSVWALDWCPRPDTKPNTLVNSEFIAVSSHPPDSSYHKLGARLSGRGMVQIWCVVNDSVKEEDLCCKTKPKSQKKYTIKEGSKPRGRPRKHPLPVVTTPANLDILTIECSEVSSNKAAVAKDQPKKPRGRPRKHPIETPPPGSTVTEQPVELVAIEFPERSSNIASVAKESDGQPREKHDIEMNCSSQAGQVLAIEYPACSSSNNSSSKAECTKDIIPPRVFLCLGHNGKVAWDVKWRPYGYSECNHRLGYLAVLLGDGSLEVWDVPSPRMLKAIYLSQEHHSFDPRFLKLNPVFRCSKLQSGDRQSIPLTLEWSTSQPHDLILAGCHDGMVAMWKFNASNSSNTRSACADVRPILCFNADTVPIRSLAWAPSQGDTESGNVIVTAGHEGMKFWDLRDPFRPLWDLSAQRFIYSLDWLPDPRCILTSYDDGTLRILSLAKAAYDVAATGKPFAGTPQQGLHSYSCSPFAIWSIQVSRQTGMVAYCGSNGTALYFQLTSKAVEKDPHRNRAPHFLCGSVTDEDGVVVVNTPLMQNAPYPMKRSENEWGNTPRSVRGLIYESNRAKRAKQHNQPLALCYGDEASSSRQEERAGIEAFPSKMVALHRVRWNVNKGGRRWLCYGGASGIVRCQEIIPPE